MSILTIEPSDGLSGTVDAPTSKSYTIRAVLCGLLGDGTSRIMSPLVSRDTNAAFNAVASLGGTLCEIEGGLSITGCAGEVTAPNDRIDTMNSGTTIRLCTAIAALAQKPVTLTGDESVRRRPINHLLDALAQVGVRGSSDRGCPPVTVCGPIMGGKISIVGDVSSQFISAIMMAAPYAESDIELIISTELKSRPYVDLTLDMLSRFGVKVENESYQKFILPSGQTYKPCKYTVEGDYSSAAFILAAAALCAQEVTVTNIFRESLQADKRIIQILDEMGADVRVRDDSVTIASTEKLKGVKVDLSDCPDLVPIVSCLGTRCEGELEIVNTEHARIKECDRIHAMACELTKMGADICERPDGLLIYGGKLNGAKVDGWSDHRVIMSLAIAGLVAQGKTVISGAEHMDVTFPDFVQKMGSIGASMMMD